MTLIPRFKKNAQARTGDVFGAPGVRYSQDGYLYNEAFEAVDINGVRQPMEPAPEDAAAKSKPAPAKGKRGAAAAAAIADDDDDTPEDEKPIDLEGWVNGTTAYVFGTVAQFLLEKTGEKPKDKDEAYDLANRVLTGEFDA